MKRHALTAEPLHVQKSRPNRVPLPFEMRPVARITRIALFEREVREKLSKSAVDALFAKASVISEGQAGKEGSFQGSTMVTMDLAAARAFLREPGDTGTARRFVALLRADESMPTRIRELARREFSRLMGKPPRQLETQIQIRADGEKVFIDVDVEADGR